MPHGDKDPFEKALNSGASQPFFDTEGGAFLQCKQNMLFELPDDLRMAPNQDHFIHIAETTIVEIGRTNGKGILIHHHGLGMKVGPLVHQDLYTGFVKYPQVPASQDIYQTHIRVLGNDHFHVNPALCGLHHFLSELKAWKEIRRFDHNLLLRLTNQYLEALFNLLPVDRGNVPDNLEILETQGLFKGIFFKYILFIYVIAFVEGPGKIGGQAAL